MNPEKKIWRSDGGMRIQASNPDTDEADAKLWRSRRFKFKIEGLGMGDVDGDGDNEVVFSSDREAAVYRFKDGRFVKVADIDIDAGRTCIGLDVGDINSNGRAEIFLTARAENFHPRSIVLEWDGSAFIPIYEGPWYFRVAWDPQTERPTLYGQRGGGCEPSLPDRFGPWPGSTGPMPRRIKSPCPRRPASSVLPPAT
jgi:hypothetical protein